MPPRALGYFFVLPTPVLDYLEKGLESDLVRIMQMSTPDSILRVLEFGAAKYEPESWRKVPDGVRRYTDALIRHAIACNVDEDAVDPESGLRHVDHMACNAAFLLELTR
jgi:hypothetical protein